MTVATDNTAISGTKDTQLGVATHPPEIMQSASPPSSANRDNSTAASKRSLGWSSASRFIEGAPVSARWMPSPPFVAGEALVAEIEADIARGIDSRAPLLLTVTGKVGQRLRLAERRLLLATSRDTYHFEHATTRDSLEALITPSARRRFELSREQGRGAMWRRREKALFHDESPRGTAGERR